MLDTEARQPRSFLPFDGAADRRDLLLWADAGVGDLHHRLEQLAARVRHRVAARGVEPAPVLQLEPGIEAEEIRRARCAVGARHLLRLVEKVRKRKTFLAG